MDTTPSFLTNVALWAVLVVMFGAGFGWIWGTIFGSVTFFGYLYFEHRRSSDV